uniref:SP-RING-type domain-containing protein n=1 Tax=Octopus bimaculoides TaxID=37653 RepID=A0A0L8IB28_OCTBM
MIPEYELDLECRGPVETRKKERKKACSAGSVLSVDDQCRRNVLLKEKLAQEPIRQAWHRSRLDGAFYMPSAQESVSGYWHWPRLVGAFYVLPAWEPVRRRFPSRNTSPNQNATSQPSSDSGSSSSNFQGKQSSLNSVKSELIRNLAVHPLNLKSSIGMQGKSPIDFSSKHNHSSPVSSLPVHPDVRLKRLPFYDILGELLKPTSLVPKPTGRFQETFFIFHLTPQQAQDIAMSRDFRPGAKCEYTTQVQLRFCLLETSCEQDDNFPPSICVRVNGKLATLPNPIPTTKPGVEPKRPGRPVDITALCRLSPTVPNHVDVSWASEFGRGYCVAVYLVKKLTSDILLQRLKQFGNRHPDHSRALIKEKLQHDPDSEIATTSLRVSLMCPLGKMRLQIPCRCSTCTHLQCFDAFTFLMMNEKKPTWICPVCDKSAAFDKLIIDGLFVEILQQSAGCTEIQFGEDGSWSPLKAVKETLLISSPVIKSSSIPGSPEKKASPQQDVIDLTMDSSSDEEDLTQHVTPSRTPSTSQTSNSSGCVSPYVIPIGTPSPPSHF